MATKSNKTNVRILQRGGKKHHDVLESASLFFMRELMNAELACILNLRIEVRATKMQRGTVAISYLPVNSNEPCTDFTIILHRDRRLIDQIQDLAHELVHVQQSVSGRLQYHRSNDSKLYAWWEGVDMGAVEDIPYFSRPWEVEARCLEVALMNKLRQAVSS